MTFKEQRDLIGVVCRHALDNSHLKHVFFGGNTPSSRHKRYHPIWEMGKRDGVYTLVGEIVVP